MYQNQKYKMKTKNNSVLGIVILFSAIVWGLVIFACSIKLKGTGCYENISTILFGGAISHIIVIFPLMIKGLKSWRILP